MRHKSSSFQFYAALVACFVAGWSAVPVHAQSDATKAATALDILDIDGNGSVDALTDAMLVMRYVLGRRGQMLVQGAIGPNATRTAAQIEEYLATMITQQNPNPVVYAPGNCSVTQTPNTGVTPVPAGTTVTLSVSCGTGSAPTTCLWTNGVVPISCSVNVAAPSSTTSYSVVASNSGGSAPSVSTTINVLPPSGGAQDFCTGTDEIIQISWPASGQFKWNTASFRNQRVAFKLLVPNTFNPPLDITHSGFVRLLEIPGSTVATREVTVSKNSCDFQSGNYLFNNVGAGDTGPYISFATNNPNGYKGMGVQMNINSGDTIYINVRNQYNGSPTCPYSACDISLDLATPNRY